MTNESADPIAAYEISDRISDAYYGSLGGQLARKVQERVHWIAAGVTGTSILDVGCSQGITSILLGREGYDVLGIDLAQTPLVRAKEYLASETISVQENVTFQHGDFMRVALEDGAYSTIIMGEVLGYLVKPVNFIARAYSLLAPQGHIIITVPFGINELLDHKSTFYLSAMRSLLHPYFEVAEASYVGNSIGFVGVRRDSVLKGEGLTTMPAKEIHRLEAEFYSIERTLRDQLSILNEDYKMKLFQEKEMAKDLEVDLNICRDVIEEHANKINILESRITEDSQNSSLLMAKLNAFKDDELSLKNSSENIKELQKIIDMRVDDIGLLGLTIINLEKDTLALKIEIEVAMKQGEAAARREKLILRSTSWRITAPIRKFTLFFRSKNKK
jgi:2-polyprenyl-3-methyl-5-hydroxy-6-metoxy-1,4-benzoquinol methylase